MAIEKFSLVDIFKQPSLFGVVCTGECAESSLFLDILHELTTDMDCVLLLLIILPFFEAFLRLGEVRIIAAIIASLLRCPWRGHLGYKFLLILDSPCHLPLKCMLISKIGLHLPDD